MDRDFVILEALLIRAVVAAKKNLAWWDAGAWPSDFHPTPVSVIGCPR